PRKRKRKRPRADETLRSLLLLPRRWPDMKTLFTAIGIIAFSGTLFAQAKAPAAKPTANPVPQNVAQNVAVDPAPTAGPEEYSYKPEGRRDPFLGLNAALSTGSAMSASPRRGDGPASFTVGEISVRGVLQNRKSFIAMIKGPDNKTYLIHQGDK